MADVEKIAAELRAGLEGVTPGRWETFPCKSLLRPEGRIGIQSRSGPLVADCGISGNTHSIPNAAHIVAAQPENIRALLDELSRLREALASVRGMLEVEYHDDGRIACVAHESGGLREMVRLLDATLARALSEREGQE